MQSYFYARSFKRLRKFDDSIELLSKVTGENSKHGFLANIELAVHYKHHTKDLHKAMEHAARAGRCEKIPSSQKVNMRKRVERLNLKLKKSKPAAGKF